MITEIFKTIAEALGLINKQVDLKNAEDVKEQAKINQKNQIIQDQITNIEERKIDEINKNISD